jgi:predicted kinase
MMPLTTPDLLIVSGAPGSGKTTLAHRLGATLGLPVLTKDDFKEVLYETTGAPNRLSSTQLGHAAIVLLLSVANRLLQARVSLVVECNFYRGLAESQLEPLIQGRRVVLVHCQGEPKTIIRRFRERAEGGKRHPCHHNAEALPRLEAQLGDGTFEPLALDVPTLCVDTTTAREYQPSFEVIVDFARSNRLTPIN